MNKPEKEKITANFDKSLLKAVRKVASDHNIPYTELMNDVLTRVFLHAKFRG
jgi:predicted DNA binding CopG/RHH family protein